MDSITQIALGASVSHAIVGKKSGIKAAAWGAFLGTFPDLDVFIPMGNDVDNFVYHRSFSHSFFVLGILAPLFAWLITKVHPNELVNKKKWKICAFVVLWTHIILDSFTVYGTQLFWPLSTHPVSIGSIFIVDPVYTVPLLLGLIISLFARKTRRATLANNFGIVFSSVYLLWTLAAQYQMKQSALESLKVEKLNFSKVLSQPTPLNSLLWRFVAVSDDGYYVGYRSIFDKQPLVSFKKYPSQNQLLRNIQEHVPVTQLQNFTHGFYSVDEENKIIIISDLRMGLEPKSYVFRFAVAEKMDSKIAPVSPYKLDDVRDLGKLDVLWKRIFDESVDF